MRNAREKLNEKENVRTHTMGGCMNNNERYE